MGIRLPSANEVAFNLLKAKPGQDVFKLGTEKFIAELPMMSMKAIYRDVQIMLKSVENNKGLNISPSSETAHALAGQLKDAVAGFVPSEQKSANIKAVMVKIQDALKRGDRDEQLAIVTALNTAFQEVGGLLRYR